MSDDRIKDDDSLVPPGGQPPTFFENPAIVVHKVEDGKAGYVINLSAFDERMDNPTFYGIVLSDLLDHLAAAYAGVTGRDQRDVREQLWNVMRDEERFKKRDPSRGNPGGASLRPKAN